MFTRIMPDKSLKLNILKRAREERWAIGQFNISTLEVLRAILQAAVKLKSPVIVGTSESESKFIGLKQAACVVKAWQEETDLPVFLNLDHGKTLGYIKKAVEAGYDMVHFDGSKLPIAENIEITKSVVEFSGRRGVTVEGEINSVKGISTILKKAPIIKKEDLTDPETAKRFIAETKVDLLAISLGSFHGLSLEGRGAERVDIERLKEIKERVPDVPFVLHGGSGLAPEEFKQAIYQGIVKININTELRAAYTNNLKKIFAEIPDEIIPYNYLPSVIEQVQAIVEEKIKLFGSDNKA